MVTGMPHGTTADSGGQGGSGGAGRLPGPTGGWTAARVVTLVMIVGPPQDALFGVVLAVNTAIGTAQELRAKRALDKLAILTAARARILRDGTSIAFAAGALRLARRRVLVSGLAAIDGLARVGCCAPTRPARSPSRACGWPRPRYWTAWPRHESVRSWER
jgi:hypothetical protein